VTNVEIACHRCVRSGHATADWLRPVEDALDAAPAPLPFFFRDDDVGWGHPRLVSLLDLFAAHGLPVDLAVIPSELDVGMTSELVTRPRVGLHQHGLAHVNHESEGRKCEFGPSRDAAAQRRDIEAGRVRLADLLGARVDPIFTPPWNRCTADTGRCLAELGFVALSRERRAEPLGISGLHELPVTVDWVADWTADRRAPGDLGHRLGDAIASGERVGLMFHHAIMDAADMRRAAGLLALLGTHDRVRAASMMELVGETAPAAGAA
jgi:hypothetical protein